MRWKSGAPTRTIRGRRGAVHSLEALLSAIVIFSTLLYASSVPKDRGREDERPLDVMGLQVLLRLDADGTLGDMVENREWSLLERSIRLALPSGFSFNVTVVDEVGNQVNDRPISNGGLIGRQIASVDYLLVVEAETCPMYRVRLQLGM